jgi:NAD(P)-dependent dehydrogenase (short-subunit alcohol dehydrogenase family)
VTNLQGRTAVVTGAGNGIGRAITLELARHGVSVIAVGRTASRLQETVTAARALEATALHEVCDVTQPDQVDQLAARLPSEVSILINNAGIAGPVKALHDITPEEWDEVFAANTKSIYLMTRAVLPAMIERRKGDILNIASVTGKRPLVGRTPYAASKLAVIGLTRTLAHEVADHGITVNSLSPGPVQGQRMSRNFQREAARTGQDPAAIERQFTARAAQQRMVTETEVAQAAIGILSLSGLCGADLDLSSGMIAPA